VRTALIGVALVIAGGVSIVTGLLPWPDVTALASRVWPILTFVVAITVVAELSAEAGLFRFVADRLARWSGGRTWALWLLVVALAVVSTVYLSLDTTAVLVTPVVVVMATQVGLSPLPFALTTVWLANTASLLLPVSNLTNLLAENQMSRLAGRALRPIDFAALTWAPAVVCVVVPVIAIFLVYRRTLAGSFTPAATVQSSNPVLLWSSAATVGALIPVLVSGVPVWIPTLAAAALLAAIFAFVQPGVLGLRLVPWPLLVLAIGLFLSVASAHALGLGELLVSVSGHGDDTASVLQLSAVGAAGANAINNLPAYLALEPVAGSPLRLVALLIGVNAGPLITPWASLATLLWHQRLTSLGVQIRWSRYVLLGLVVAPVTVVLATLVLSAVVGH
jgi:arsenical pump membrane protein